MNNSDIQNIKDMVNSTRVSLARRTIQWGANKGKSKELSSTLDGRFFVYVNDKPITEENLGFIGVTFCPDGYSSIDLAIEAFRMAA